MRTLVPAIAQAVVLAAVLGSLAGAAAQDQPAMPAPSQDAAKPAAPSSQAGTPAAPKAQAQTPAAPAPPPQGAPPQPPPANRYSFQRVDDGFLRFDHVSGHVGYCSARSGSWACQAVPENRAALDNEVARLQETVAALQKEVEALREPPPPRPPALIPPPAAKPGAGPPAATPDKNGGIKLPSDEDIARARAYIEETWRRLVDMIDRLQKDMMRQRDRDGGLSRT